MGSIGSSSSSAYVQTAVATAPTGEVYVLWIDQAAKTIHLRRREPSGAWHGATFLVMRGHEFAVEPALVVRSNGQLIAAWRDYAYIKYAYSNNRGETWSGVGTITAVQAYRSQTHLAAGPNGEVAIAFTRDQPRPLHVVVALWNGTGFGAPVDVNGATSDTFADPSVSFSPDAGPNTRIAVAYRAVAGGVMVGERLVSTFNQPWSVPSPAIGHIADGRVSVDYDQYGTLHLAWIRQGSSGRGSNQLYYTARPVGQTAFLPVASAPTIAPIFNAWGDARAGSRVYMHVVHEFFQGANVIPRYVQFQALRTVFGAAPVIEGGASIVSGDSRTTVSVTFPELENLSQRVLVRWRWNAPPTDDASDSGGWQLLSNTATATTVLNVPIPTAFRTANDCSPRVLYTQLRLESSSGVQTEPVPRSAAVAIDTSVVAQVEVRNPLLYSAEEWYPSNIVVRDLDPNSTPIPQLMLSVSDLGDCSRVTRVRVASNAAALAVNSDLDVDGDLVALVPLPGVKFPISPTDQVYPVFIRVYDSRGNSQTITRNIRFDNRPPVISGTVNVTATDSPLGDILQDLTFDFSAANIIETNGVYGFLIAVSPTAVTNPASDPSLVWLVAPANVNAGQVTVSSWSLANAPGVTTAMSSTTPQTFYLYMRLIDRAGNIGEDILTTTADSTLTPARLYIPLTSR
ncbi:exo-alpha-sialidase [Chloroflexus sp.]|uniref:exo-alpha-sialidase n=1 Tax=Chloroflexus sp. TaxID=1904827 RepID=UPI00298EECE5|nr:exo-alpha-sialidase [Chloroflexus sp.]MDW8402684.1 exo-alpha-sialidase [Chloroflexus sp.]